MYGEKYDAQIKKNIELQQKIDMLDEELTDKQVRLENTKDLLLQREAQFSSIQRKVNAAVRVIRKGISLLKSIVAYLLGRRNIKQLYSRAYKRKQAENDLKKYKYYLYELGFTVKALADLEGIYNQPANHYQKRAAAWELSLWYASKYTIEGAQQALNYIPAVIHKETDIDQLRKAAIIKAECLEILNDREKGKQVVDNALHMQQHPDLFLANANLEEKIDARTEWLNKAMEAYNLQPVHFISDNKNLTYDDLKTIPFDRKIENGSKVSVILPAYNAESGISTAIESILSQTWKNIELVVVDDCSSDNTKDVVKQYVAKDSRVKLLSTRVNSGPYIARNIALEAATGNYVTVNDSDDWSHAEKIEKQAEHLEKNRHVIANTSEHARLTNELKFYRRGTPGKYIFSNMSSFMFRREPVLEKLGYWDSVRFAADGEFKRRLIEVFGKPNIVDLKTGPLSLPRQSVTSLTGSSAFGYNGFFKGVRKEYVESFEFFHKRTSSFVYPLRKIKRAFPVPEPMWPKRVAKLSGYRQFDIIIAADFRLPTYLIKQTIDEIRAHEEMGLITGLVQMAEYNLDTARGINPDVRELIDGDIVQMLVYGERVACDILVVNNPSILQEYQLYIPKIEPKVVRVVVEQSPSERTGYNIRTCSKNLFTYFEKKGKWYPKDKTIRDTLEKTYHNEIRFIYLSEENWPAIHAGDHTFYSNFLGNWLADENPYVKGDG